MTVRQASDEAVINRRPDVEHADVVIVGARCAGSSAAVHFAQRGLKVIVLDKARFPSNTLSTHAMMVDGVAELARMGALEKMLALNPSLIKYFELTTGDVAVREQWPNIDGIDYSLCVPRTDQDAILTETARAAGADVREKCAVEEVLFSEGRAVGVRYRDRKQPCEIRAKLVVGADGRRSTVADAVGSWQPYRRSADERGLVYGYLDDPQPNSRLGQTNSVWRNDGRIAMTFPCTPKGRLLTVLLPPNDEIPQWRDEPSEMWKRELDRFPADGFPSRIAGTEQPDRIRTGGDLISYFRTSTGPGWVLVGDSGHFKDPCIGRGMSDALHFARRLAERTADVVNDPKRLDAQLRNWERERDRRLLPTYHFGNREGRNKTDSQLVLETLRTFSHEAAQTDICVAFTRQRTPERVIGLTHLTRGFISAMRRSNTRTSALLAEAASELPAEIGIRLDRRAKLPRSSRLTKARASERPDVLFPKSPSGRQ